MDGIRGAAILLVFVFHYFPRHRGGNPLAQLAGLGWIGVDLFFTLSGFLITGILVDTLAQPHYFKNFYSRRALRLFPAYICMVAAVLAISYIHGDHPTLWSLPFFLYGSNIVANMDKPLGLGNHVQLPHLWSLAVEEQFYLLWPPLVFFLRERRKILIACVAGSLFSIVLRVLLAFHPSAHYLPYNELPTRLDALLFGAMLSLFTRNPKGATWPAPGTLRLVLLASAGCIALCVAVAHTLFWSSKPMILGGYLASAVASTCIITSALQPGTWAYRVGNIGILRTFGRYSYGLYLWHMLPAAVFLGWIDFCDAKVRLGGGIFGFATVGCLCFLWAYVSYHALELPFLRFKNRFSYSDEQRRDRVNIDQVEAEPGTASLS